MGDRKELRDLRTVIGSSLSQKSRNKDSRTDRLTQYIQVRNATVSLNAVRIDC